MQEGDHASQHALEEQTALAESRLKEIESLRGQISLLKTFASAIVASRV